MLKSEMFQAQWPVSFLTNLLRIAGVWPVYKLPFLRHKIGNAVLIVHTIFLFVFFICCQAKNIYFVQSFLGFSKTFLSFLLVILCEIFVKVCILHIAICKQRSLACLTRLQIVNNKVKMFILISFLLPHVLSVWRKHSFLDLPHVVQLNRLTTFSESTAESIFWVSSGLLSSLFHMTEAPIYLVLFWSWALKNNYEALEDQLKDSFEIKEKNKSEIVAKTKQSISEMSWIADNMDTVFRKYNTAITFTIVVGMVNVIFIQAVDGCFNYVDFIFPLLHLLWRIFSLCLCGELLHGGVSLFRAKNITSLPVNICRPLTDTRFQDLDFYLQAENVARFLGQLDPNQLSENAYRQVRPLFSIVFLHSQVVFRWW